MRKRTMSLDDIFSDITAEGLREFKSYGKQWRDIAREEQIRPEGVDTFVIRGGRGSGKTRAGAEDFLERMRSGDTPALHMIAPTRDDVKKVMIEGISGIQKCAKPGEIVKYNKSELEVHFSNGVIARGFSGEQPDRLNGPQAGHCWFDEFYAIPVTSIQQARFGNRIGTRVTEMYTSTPKTSESTNFVLALKDAYVQRMRTSENIDNLSARVVTELYEEFKGTRQERVELEGEVDEQIEGALWKVADFNARRMGYNPAYKRTWEEQNGIGLMEIVVAIDPTVSDTELKDKPFKKPDECGIIVAGSDHRGHGYTLADLSLVGSPEQWCEVAVKAYNDFGADKLVFETNQGGMLIRDALRVWAAKLHSERWTRNSELNLVPVRAYDSKGIRAEPLQMLYAQGRWHHCSLPGAVEDPLLRARIEKTFAILEAEMTTWNALQSQSRRRSPNRIDASVIAAHALGLVTVYDCTRRSMLKRYGG